MKSYDGVLAFELVGHYAVLAGFAMLALCVLGLLSLTDFPGFPALKRRMMFPALKGGYCAVLVLVSIAFFLLFGAIVVNFGIPSGA